MICRCEANHIEAAAQVYLDHPQERIKRVRPVPAEHLFRQHDAGGVDDPAQRARALTAAPTRGATLYSSVTSTRTNRAFAA